MGEGYNRGARQAVGDILIFCHDDIEFLTPDTGHKLVGRLDEYDFLGVAGSTWLCDVQWGSAGLPYERRQVVHALADAQDLPIPCLAWTALHLVRYRRWMAFFSPCAVNSGSRINSMKVMTDSIFTMLT